MFQPHALFCIFLLFVSANGFQEQAKQIDLQDDCAKSNVHQSQNAKRFVKKMAKLSFDGDYGPSANVDTVLSPPPPPFTMKKLLEDYTPMANRRNNPSPRRRLLQAHTLTVKGRSLTASLQRTQLLQDYTPSSNQRSKGPPPSMRRLLQDYSPVANDRSPSGNRRRRRLLQDYSPAANERSPSNNRKRKLLQDYTPVANDRPPTNSNKRRLLQD